VASKSLKAQAYKTGAFDCSGGDGGGAGGAGGQDAGTVLSSTVQGEGGMVSLAATRDAKGTVTQTVMRMDDAAATAPASIFHHISVPAPAAAFTTAGDLTSAAVRGSGPFLAGSATFASESAFGTTATGTLTGDLVANFDSIGRLPVAADGPSAVLVSR
jgi:hypothetical protein